MSPPARPLRRLALPAAGALALVLMALPLVPASADPPQDHPGAEEVDGRRSGLLYVGPETRALQEDEFTNPASFSLAYGEELWSRPEGAAGLSCATCHGDAAETMRGVAAHYPKYDAARQGLVNIEMRINAEREARMGAAPWTYESDELLALTTYVSAQSRGIAMEVDIDGPARPFFEQGQTYFETRRGQLDISCAQCHDDLAGDKLRGDTISQGQVNGFPFYRLSWRSMGSRHRIFEWCNTSIRAEPAPLGSDEYLALELYMAWRGRGLAIETPAVRR